MRYIIPAMFIATSVFYLSNFIAFALFLASAVLTYSGYKGYGQKFLEEKK